METMGDKPRQLQIAQGQGTLPQVEPEETAVWKDRDACRVVIGSDNAEYEGTIKASVTKEILGTFYFVYIGYFSLASGESEQGWTIKVQTKLKVPRVSLSVPSFVELELI